MNKLAVSIVLIATSSVFAAVPEGWQFSNGIYTPILEEVTNYPTLNANESVYVGPGTNVTLSADQSLTNAKQGDTATFVGSTLTSTGILIVKGNDSKITFNQAHVSTPKTLAMNNSSAKPSGVTEIRFENGSEAAFDNGIWWQTGGNPTAARLVVSNSTVTAESNRVDIKVGAVKTGEDALCDFAVEIERGGVMKTHGFSATGNANSHFLKVRQGGKYESTAGFAWSSVAGVHASVVCENGSRLEVTGGSVQANAGAKIVFDLVSPATPEEVETAIFSKLAGDYAAFADGFLGEIRVGKRAAGTYKLMEVRGHSSSTDRRVTGIEEFKQHVSVVNVGSAKWQTTWETVGTGTATTYALYVTVKRGGLCVIVR